MKTVTVAKADSIVPDEPIEDMVVEFTGKVPGFDWSHGTEAGLEAAAAFYQSEAVKIADALRVLPGGTLNRLTAELLQRAAGHLRVTVAPSPGERITRLENELRGLRQFIHDEYHFSEDCCEFYTPKGGADESDS
jgi:hypothetical protein